MKKDRIFIAVYVLVCIIASVMIYALPQGDGKGKAVIYRDGERVASLPLSADGEYTFPDISYTVAVKDGRAFIRESHCPGMVCVNTGKVYLGGASIICVPNGIMVRIEKDKVDIDAVAG